MNNCPSSMWLPTVMNKNTYIGERTESNALYAVPPPPKQQVVISCNLVADGVLWISPTTKATKINAQYNESMDWVDKHIWWEFGHTFKGFKLPRYLSACLVMPISCPEKTFGCHGGLIPRAHDSLERPERGHVEGDDREKA